MTYSGNKLYEEDIHIKKRCNIELTEQTPKGFVHYDNKQKNDQKKV